MVAPEALSSHFDWETTHGRNVMYAMLVLRCLSTGAKRLGGFTEGRTIDLSKRKSSYHSAALGDTDAVATGDHMEGLIGSMGNSQPRWNIKVQQENMSLGGSCIDS